MSDRANISVTSANDLATPPVVEMFVTGWQSLLSRDIPLDIRSLRLCDVDIDVSRIRVKSRLPKTAGLVFPDGELMLAGSTSDPDHADTQQLPSDSQAEAVTRATTLEPNRAEQAGAGKNSHSAILENVTSNAGKPGGTPEHGVREAGVATEKEASPQTGKRTRLRPPRDLVKLEDRLFFVLQPPLETLVANARLEFPFEPFPYQFDGIAFLFPREAAILADEMGLGKTMQAITTIRMLLLASQLRNVLLICPKPLVSNWVREFSLWAPEIPITVIEGDAARRRWIWQQRQIPVRIANYELLMRDHEMLDQPDFGFDLVVLDEAQRIKNRHSTTAEVARSIPRGRAWALTGTPIENSVEDLVNIFEFLLPGYLTGDMPLKNIRDATRDYIVRRTKDKVLTEMPPKMFRDEQLELTPAQHDSYRSAEEEGVVQLEHMGETLTIQHVFELVLRLKQICNFDPSTGSSCKLERLVADLEEIAASGQKAIVFSQWVETLDKLVEPLERFGPMEYHGRIPSRKRDQVIEQFKQDQSKHVILMSYGAGSVGLNLQFCEYVFLFDRWWNPAIEDQAVNRAHRIGAAGPVTVTRMMAAGTIEQRIHEVLEQKRELFNQLFADDALPGNAGPGLSQEEIFGLFDLSVGKPPSSADSDSQPDHKAA